MSAPHPEDIAAKSAFIQHLIGSESAFLKQAFDIDVLSLSQAATKVDIALPANLEQRPADYLRQHFPHMPYELIGTVQGNRPVARVALYPFKEMMMQLAYPLSRRVQPDVPLDTRVALADEYKRLQGKPIDQMVDSILHADKPIKRDIKEKAHHGHDHGIWEGSIEETLASLAQADRMPFEAYYEQGKLHIPVAQPDHLLLLLARNALDQGLIKPENLQLTEENAHVTAIKVTPTGLLKLNQIAVAGIRAQEGGQERLLHVMSPDVTAQRKHYMSRNRSLAELKLMSQDLLNAMSESQLENIKSQLGPDRFAGLAEISKTEDGTPSFQVLASDREGIETLHRAVQSVYQQEPAGAVDLDAQQMLAACDAADKLLDDPQYWKGEERPGSLRALARQDFNDLRQILTDESLSPQGLEWLTQQSRYAPTIRGMGYLLGIVAGETDFLGHQRQFEKGFGFGEYHRAFGQTRKQVKGEFADAAYHIRNLQGEVGLGEKALKVAYLGVLGPIKEMTATAREYPLLVGGTVVGSAYVSFKLLPPKWSIPGMILRAVNGSLKVIGINFHEEMHDAMHHAKDSLPEKSRIKRMLDKIDNFTHRALGEECAHEGHHRGHDHPHHHEHGQSHDKTEKVAGKRLGGILKKVPGASGGFAAGVGLLSVFVILEDMIVHLPLTFFGLGVGTAAGYSGRDILVPAAKDVKNQVNDVLPVPVQNALGNAASGVGSILKGTPIKAGFDEIGHTAKDIQELGMYPTATGVFAKRIRQNWQDLQQKLQEKQVGVHAG